MVADWIVQGWHRFGLRVITGLFWFVVDVFKGILETIERLMYAVDEWLRFRSGESGASLVAKAGLGLLWFFVAYVLRFCVNVLIEPQINPIKHFPVVTVGHKLLLGAVPAVRRAAGVDAWSRPWHGPCRCAVIWSIPGIFGFLVWELTENWRLYAANRRRNLFPVPIGSHGETMARLLKPGFHSGTLPKRFAKLRRAERHARAGGNWHAVRKHLQALDRVEASIRRYVEREFLELFAQSRCWQAPAVTLEDVRLGTNSVRLAIGCPGIAEAALQIALEVESGWLVAGVTSPGWIDRLLPHQRQVLATAIIGLYKSAGVDLVRQQIEGAVPAARCRGTTFRRRGWCFGRTARAGRGGALRSSRRPVDRPAVGPRLGAAAVADDRAAAARFRRGAGALGRLGGGLEPGRGRPGPPARIASPRCACCQSPACKTAARSEATWCRLSIALRADVFDWSVPAIGRRSARPGLRALSAGGSSAPPRGGRRAR